jgi:hypothetical protein
MNAGNRTGVQTGYRTTKKDLQLGCQFCTIAGDCGEKWPTADKSESDNMWQENAHSRQNPNPTMRDQQGETVQMRARGGKFRKTFLRGTTRKFLQ